MKKAIIFANGNLADLKNASGYIKMDDFIICADGGINHALKLGLKPHLVIGDVDSLPANQVVDKIKTKKELSTKPAIANKKSILFTLDEKLAKHLKYKVKLICHQPTKDQSDTELAIRYALKQGFDQILIFGLLGTRVDHLLANLLLLANPAFKGAKIMIVEGNQEIFVVKKSICIKGERGDYLSLIPLTKDVVGVTLAGLKFKLTHGVLKFGSSRGISNVFIGKRATISVKRGVLLVIHERL